MINLPRVGGLSFVRQLLSPATTGFEQEFGSGAFRLLLAGNALHADIPLDGAGSADQWSVHGFSLSASGRQRAGGLWHECGSGRAGARFAQATARLVAALGEVGETAQRLAIAHLDPKQVYGHLSLLAGVIRDPLRESSLP